MNLYSNRFDFPLFARQRPNEAATSMRAKRKKLPAPGIFYRLSTVSVLLMFCFIQQNIAEDAVPGKQIVQEIELPASTSTWLWGQDGMKNIGEPRSLDESEKEMVRYWIFLPVDYQEQVEKNGGVPLLLFLHGAGERGSTSEEIGKVKVHGPPKLLDKEEFAGKFPCVTVSPQCKNDFCWSPAQLMLLLNHIETNFKIDKNRIYISGISMGGFGTWMCLQEAPNRFAAAAPICGGAKPEWADKLTEIPIWNFHGDKDGAVPFVLSQAIVNSILKAGGKKIIFSVYNGTGHDVWTRTYDNQLLFDWLFSHAN